MPCYGPSRVSILRKPAYPGAPRTLDEQEVPCGHCLGCRAEQARQWAVRITHEAQMHDSSWFVTLTYNDDNLPANGSLDPSHPRDFIKRLREYYPPKSLSYYLCGEYGEETDRPHYHAVLFGADLPDKRVWRGSPPGTVWRSDFLEDTWGLGNVEFSSVTFASAAYVAGYVRKKVHSRTNPDYYLRYDAETGELHELEPEFARMSRNPAIGKRWIEKYWEDVYPRDYVVIDGYESKPPRYYDKWLEKHHPEIAYDVKYERWNPDLDTSPEKLAAKQAIHESRIKLFSGRNTL